MSSCLEKCMSFHSFVGILLILHVILLNPGYGFMTFMHPLVQQMKLINLSDSSSPRCAPQGSVAVPLLFLLYHTRPKFISVLGVTIIRTMTSSSAIQLS